MVFTVRGSYTTYLIIDWVKYPGISLSTLGSFFSWGYVLSSILSYNIYGVFLLVPLIKHSYS
ncbi:MAG: hypothetical protein DJ555_05180 [Desulfurococcaceae archaeon]|nr:MAG: hypothetical protein DJ555_05180 [Desulfurococcaceae archaeon]